MNNKELLKKAIKIILDFYISYYKKEKELPSLRDFAIILLYELDLKNMEESYSILEYLNHIGFLIYDNGKYKINIDAFF